MRLVGGIFGLMRNFLSLIPVDREGAVIAVPQERGIP